MHRYQIGIETEKVKWVHPYQNSCYYYFCQLKHWFIILLSIAWMWKWPDKEICKELKKKKFSDQPIDGSRKKSVVDQLIVKIIVNSWSFCIVYLALLCGKWEVAVTPPSESSKYTWVWEARHYSLFIFSRKMDTFSMLIHNWWLMLHPEHISLLSMVMQQALSVFYFSSEERALF